MNKSQQVFFERLKLAGATQQEAELLLEARSTNSHIILKKTVEQIAKGNSEPLLQTLQRLSEKIELPTELQEKLDKIGDNPVVEPEIAKAIEDEAENGIIPIATIILTNEEIKKYTAIEIADFVYAVKVKVYLSFKDEDGNFKSTPFTQDAQLPNALEIDEMQKAIKKEFELVEQLVDKKLTQKQREKLLKEKQQVEEKNKNRAFEIAGLKREDLSIWEQNLVIQMTTEAIRGFRNHSQGKHF